MGNCIQRGGGSAVAGEDRPAERSGRRRSSGGDGEEDHGAAAASVVKVVLTKGELGWLVARLKEAGDRRLEDVLHEVARKREDRAAAGGGGDGWRPSLKSIVECPAETTTEAAAPGSGASLR